MAKLNPIEPLPLYERDFYEWTIAQAALLRREAARRGNTELDVENLAEEIEGLGKSDRRALTSHVARVIEHLLKLQHSPAKQPRALWQNSVDLHRIEADKILADSPSLRRYLGDNLERCYRDGRRLAARGLKRDPRIPALPERCPYRLDDILDPDWWPSR
jgi:hypothetical protein